MVAPYIQQAFSDSDACADLQACQDPSKPEETAPSKAAADQVRQELVQLLLAAFTKRQRQAQKQKQSKGAPLAAPHNLAAVTMLCMQPGYEGRAVDFMPVLFAELPQQVTVRLL